MKSIKWLYIFFLTFTHGFIHNPRLCRTVKVNLKLFHKKTNRFLYYATPNSEYVIENKEHVIDKSVSILSDNIVNEILYILKFSNLSNDSENAYIYIFLYEFMTFGFKVIKSPNQMNLDKDYFTEKNTPLIKELIFNIIIYLLIKNILVANFISLVNH